MTDNVIPIHGNTVPGQPVAAVIDTLADLLIRAQKGEIVAVAIVSVESDGERHTMWDGGTGTADQLAAAIAMLQHRFTADMIERTCRGRGR